MTLTVLDSFNGRKPTKRPVRLGLVIILGGIGHRKNTPINPKRKWYVKNARTRRYEFLLGPLFWGNEINRYINRSHIIFFAGLQRVYRLTSTHLGICCTRCLRGKGHSTIRRWRPHRNWSWTGYGQLFMRTCGIVPIR
jgi:hypothetical protein